LHVTAVVVAYNRRELLVEALGALERQSVPVDSIVVVDNASTDGSAEAAARELPRTDVLRLDRNTGGAGGFAVGIERAITGHSADLVWIMDDDTIPTPTALEELLRVREAHPARPVVLASRVVWTDGTDHPMNTPRAKPFARRAERRAAASVGAVAVRSASFVSSLVDTRAIRRSGLPIGEYFIWNDDFEFTARLLRSGRGVYVPGSVVTHKTKVLASTDVDPGSRFFFEVRNKIWLFRLSRALSPIEKPLYAGVSIVRWGKTIISSRDRATLLSGLGRGLRDGFRSNPRGNSDFLAGLGPVSDDIAAFERAGARTRP